MDSERLANLIFASSALLVLLGFILWLYWGMFNPDEDEVRVIRIKYKDFDIIRKSCKPEKLYYTRIGIKYIDNDGIVYYLKFNLIDTFRAKQLYKRIEKDKRKQKNNNNYQIMVNETIEHLNKLKSSSSN